MGAPTLEEARRAAEAVLAETPDAEVLLYGSVARGEAKAHSDVDLYVLYADIDYAQRHQIAKRLTRAVTAALNGRSFDLHVSDLPEWEGRSGISNTFEHEISQDAMSIAGRVDRDEACWSKKQVRPMTVCDEARRYLEENLQKEIDEVIRHAAPQPDEQPRRGSPMFPSDADAQNEERMQQRYAETIRLNRMVDLTASCAMVVELSLKAAGTLQGLHPVSLKDLGHSIDDALTALHEPLQQELRGLAAGHGLRPKDITGWRVRATYADDFDVMRSEADANVFAYLDTAIDVADRVITEHEAHGAAEGLARRSLRRLQDVRSNGRIRRAREVDAEALRD